MTVNLKILASVALAILIVAGFILFSSDDVTGEGATEGSKNAVWQTRCDEPGEGQDKGYCEAFQSLFITETKQRLAEFAIGFPESGEAARGVVILPLGMLLETGAQMRIDSEEPVRFNMRYCDMSGCFSFVNLNKDLLSRMRKGSMMTITFMAANGQNVNVQMSLEGLSQALRKVS